MAETPVVRFVGAKIPTLTVVARQMCPWKDIRGKEKLKTVWSPLPLASNRVPRRAEQEQRNRSVPTREADLRKIINKIISQLQM